MQNSVEQKIWQIAALQPDKIAVKSGKQTATYREICQRIIAARDYYLFRLNCSIADTVIIAAGKQIEFIYAYFGAHLAHLKVVPIDASTNPTRLEYIVNQTNSKLMIGFDRCELNITKVPLKDFSNVICEFEIPDFPTCDEIADILFTTGTTGKPKGVPLTFSNEAAAARNINEYIGMTDKDIELLALPVSHSFGLGRIRCCLSKGSTLILLGSFTNVKKIFRTMEEESVTGFSMVPASWRYLKKFSGNKLGDFASQLRYIEMGSAYFSKEEKQELADLLPNTRVCMHYGLTEASRSTFMEFHEDKRYLESVGKASPNTEIKVMDENGIEVPNNIEGEICVKGQHVTNGYLDVAENTAFFQNYFRTGDWGYKTDEGYIYLISRKKELINVGGKKVSPIEVEEQLAKIEGVDDCACIGVTDRDGVLGEVVKAFVVRSKDSDISIEDIKKHMLGKLESYKLPVCYEWIDEIPKTQNGKIQRGLLK